jgi:hypothetical protein
VEASSSASSTGRGYGRALLMISCFLSIALIIDEFTAE